MRWTQGRVGAALAAGAVVVLAACSGGGAGSSGAGSNGAGSNGAGDAARAMSVPSGTAAGPASAPADGGGAGGTVQKSTAVATARIRTASVSLDVPHDGDVATRADAASTLALKAGGEVDSDDRTAGQNPVATMVLRVPPAALTGTLRAIARLGTVTSQQQASEDVTWQVADVSSRVASAQRAIARLRTLYDSAAKVSDVLAVERDLADREADLEALQAQQRSLDGRTSLAAITLTVQPASAAPTHHAGHGGFVGGLQDGWTGFRHAATAVARAVGAAVPFLVLLVVLAAAAVSARGLLRRRAAGRSPQES